MPDQAAFVASASVVPEYRLSIRTEEHSPCNPSIHCGRKCERCGVTRPAVEGMNGRESTGRDSCPA